MTFQIPHHVIFQSQYWNLERPHHGKLFDLGKYKVKTYPTSTADHMGYQSCFKIKEGKLLLDSVEASLTESNCGFKIRPTLWQRILLMGKKYRPSTEPKKTISINHVLPSKVYPTTDEQRAVACNLPPDHLFPPVYTHVYENVDLEITYTGHMLIYNGFIQEWLSIHSHYRSWGSKKVFELEFADGRLLSTKDLSGDAEKIRSNIQDDTEHRTLCKDHITDTCFDRHYFL